MSYFSLNSVEGLEALRTLSEGSIAPASVVDVLSVSSRGSGLLMDESVVGDLENYVSDDDVRSIGSGMPMDESVIDYYLENYDSDTDTVLTEVTDPNFVDLFELLEQEERPPLIQKKERRAR